MKKAIAFLLAMLMLVGLAACGGNQTPPEPSQPSTVQPSEPPAAPAGTMTQVVTVNLLGNDIPVDLIRNFDTGAFRIDYQFNGNEVFAEGFVLEDGTWEISDTNNDFTFGTIEAVIPAIDESAWVASATELVVTPPADEPEPSVDPAPTGDPVIVDPAAEPLTQTVTVEMMGNPVEVTVVKTGSAFEMRYSSFGNDVCLTGTVADGVWTMESAEPAEVAAFAGNIVNSVAAAIDEAAWTSVIAEPLTQTVTVEMMGNPVEVTVVKTGSAFEMRYSSFGNDVCLTGTVADGVWTMESAEPAEVAAFAGNIVNSVAAAIDEAAWVPAE